MASKCSRYIWKVFEENKRCFECVFYFYIQHTNYYDIVMKIIGIFWQMNHLARKSIPNSFSGIFCLLKVKYDSLYLFKGRYKIKEYIYSCFSMKFNELTNCIYKMKFRKRIFFKKNFSIFVWPKRLNIR